jgi:hypothetical protein
MNDFDIKKASLEELKKKEKFNNSIAAFFIGIFIFIVVLNVFTAITKKTYSISSASFLIFVLIGLSIKGSNKAIQAEIKSREQTK